MAMKNVSIRIDEDLKKQAEQVFSEIGIPFATALNVFLRKAVSCGGFPFELKVDVPNSETIEAIQEAEHRDPNAKRYKNFSEILAEVTEESP